MATSTGPDNPVLELRNVTCAYESGRAAVENVCLSAREGEIVCLLGPSGCGKTTTLRAIAGFEPVASGEIYLAGKLVTSPQTMVPTEQRHIGMVFQEYALFPHLRVGDNIGFGLERMAPAQRSSEIARVVALTGLIGLERRFPHELSGGQQQRVALARAMVLRPVVLLLDEPFSNLDPDMRDRMRQELHAVLRQTKTTTVMVTHDHEEAFAMADRIAVMNQGRLEQCDGPETIYHLPVSPFVAEFVGQADFVPGIVEGTVVRTEIGEFANSGGLAPGAQVVVMVRPDDFHLVPDDQGAGRVLMRQFRGSENLYGIKLASGMVIHCSETSTSIHAIDTRVAIRIIATHSVIFPRPAADGSAARP